MESVNPIGNKRLTRAGKRGSKKPFKKDFKMAVYVSEEELTQKQAEGFSNPPRTEIAAPSNDFCFTGSNLGRESTPEQMQPKYSQATIEVANLAEMVQNAENIHEYELALQYLTRLIEITEDKGTLADLVELQERMHQLEILAIKDKQSKIEPEATAAERGRNYAKAARLYEQCKNLSNQLHKMGIPGEEARIKYFTIKTIAMSQLVAATTILAKC
jgi:hypothetical protein